MTIKIGITGATGRMGRMLAETIFRRDGICQLTAAIERQESSLNGADMGELLGIGVNGTTVGIDLAAAIAEVDVVIDFTMPEATLSYAALCARHRVPLVVGTTGFTDAQITQLHAITQDIPLCHLVTFCHSLSGTYGVNYPQPLLF